MQRLCDGATETQSRSQDHVTSCVVPRTRESDGHRRHQRHETVACRANHIGAAVTAAAAEGTANVNREPSPADGEGGGRSLTATPSSAKTSCTRRGRSWWPTWRRRPTRRPWRGWTPSCPTTRTALMEHAAESGNPRVPLRGHRRTGQRAHTERRHLLVPRGRTGADQRTGQPGGHKTRSSAF